MSSSAPGTASRDPHEKLRAAKFREIVEDGAFYGQPHSEPVARARPTPGSVSAAGTSAPPRAGRMAAMRSTDGSFSPLAGCAPYYATPAIRLGDEPWIERKLYLPGSQGRAGCVLPRRVGSDGEAGHDQPMGGNDRLIAARALAAQLTLVAGDRGFARIPELLRENWLTGRNGGRCP